MSLVHIEPIITESTRSQFENRVRQELEAYASEMKEENGQIIDNATITQYVDNIVTKSINDGTFSSTIADDGQPDNWENDWIREFIQDNSDWFTKFQFD
jgi:hypothetical protein